MGLVHRLANRLRLDYRIYRSTFEMGRNLAGLAAGGTGRIRGARFNAEGGETMMKRLQTKFSLAAIVALSLLMGCNARLPGQPTEAERWRAPADISDFSELYTQNCAGCH